jgi:hypothetical protein
MTKHWTEFTKKELLKLPKLPWGEVGIYEFVLLVNSRTKHESGYNLFAIIGCREDNKKLEIAGYCDDYRLPFRYKYSPASIDFAIDCSMHGVFRIHSDKLIIMKCPCSTTNLEFAE